jgi:hypothetical protein
MEDFAIPLESIGFESAELLVRTARDHAWRIDVLDAHEPVCAVRAGIEITSDRGEQRAQMQRTRG